MSEKEDTKNEDLLQLDQYKKIIEDTFLRIDNVLDEALKIAEGIKDDSLKAGALSSVADRYADAGKYIKALDIAKKINVESEKEIALAYIISRLASVGQFDAAFKLLEEIGDEGDKGFALGLIAYNLAEAGEFDDALDLARDFINDKRWEERALSFIAVGLLHAGKFDETLKIAREISDKKEKAGVLGHIASMLAEIGEPYKHIYDEFYGTIKNSDGYGLSGILSAKAFSFANIGKYDEALEIAGVIRDKHFKATALASVASEMAKSGGEFKSTLNEAIRIARSLEDEPLDENEDFEMRLTRVTIALASVASEMAKSGKRFEYTKIRNEALSTARSIQNESLKSEALASFVSELAEPENYDDVLEITQEINNESEKTDALTSVASAMAESGDYNEALEIARGINDEGQRAKLLADVASTMTNIRSIIVKKIADSAREASDDAKARAHIFDVAIEIAYESKDQAEKFELLVEIIEEMVNAGDPDKALKTAQGIKDKTAKGRALESIVKYLVRAERFNEALKTAQEIGHILSKKRSLAFMHSNYNKMITQLRVFPNNIKADKIRKDKQIMKVSKKSS